MIKKIKSELYDLYLKDESALYNLKCLLCYVFVAAVPLVALILEKVSKIFNISW